MGDRGMAVGVLGPLLVSVEGRQVAVSAGRLRATLAVLAMSPGEGVPIDRLVDAVWGEELPDHPRRTLRIYVTRLRQLLGSTAIDHGPSGYRLRIAPDGVDAIRFTRMLDAAARVADPAVERERLAQALGLWRGTPFEGVPSPWLHEVDAVRLGERRLNAVERRIELDLAAGEDPGGLVAELRALTDRSPLRERLWAHLMTALYRCGRQADALAAYRTLRRTLDEQLGVEPAAALRDLHLRILNRDSALEVPTEKAPPTPRQLPAGTGHFTGRQESLERLDALIAGDPPMVVISAIAGMAGVGKTTLAVHWAHRVADRFADGQLYVDLRGYDPSGHVLEPAEALRGFLHALGVPPRQVPVDPQAQAGLYRSLLAGKRVLVLLDNARDSEQVRPLLPGTPGCLAIVTSRSRLAALVATGGADPLVLDVFTAAEAWQFLAGRLGPGRIAAELDAAEAIVAHCAALPLALAVVAARAVTYPSFPLREIAAELAAARGRLDADVRAVFSWSYRALTPPAARLFRLLGLHPGPHVSGPVAASLGGVPEVASRSLLAELAGSHMVMEGRPGRYGLHDLLRAYATQLAHRQDTAAERRAAIHRMLDHYLHTSHAAGTLINPHRDHPITLAPPREGASPERVGDGGAALAWIAETLPALVALVPLAARERFDTHAWQLAWSISAFLGRHGHWQEWVDTQLVALSAVRRAGQPAEEARTHRGLARAYRQVGRFDDARTHLERARALYAGLGDEVGLGHTHNSMGQLFAVQERFDEALAHAELAVELFRRTGDAVGEALALNGIGWCQAQLGEHEKAYAYCQQALYLQRRAGDRDGEATTLDSLGFIHHGAGDLGVAVAYFERSLALRGDAGDRHAVARTLVRLGDSHAAAGDRTAAHDAWRRALTILERLDKSEAAALRGRLDQATGRPPARADASSTRE